MHRPGVLPFEQHRLPNGITLLLLEDHTAPLVAVMVMVHAGSRNEVPGRTGFAHLFEHLMFKGSAGVAEGEHFRRLQKIGATVNGTTSEDRTNYFEVVPTTGLQTALELEADRFGTLLSALTQEKLDNQREVVKNERRQSYDNQPYGRVNETLAAALFPAGHPHSWPVIGSMEDLAAATLEDVRTFFLKYYAPGNLSLALAGDIDPQSASREAERTLGAIPPRPTPAVPSIDDAFPVTPRRLVLKDAVTLPRIHFTWKGPRINTRQEAVFDLLTNHLCIGRNSRLHRALVYREQIAQGVGAYVEGMEGVGIVEVIATAHPGQGLGAIERSLLNQLEAVARDGLTGEEFAAARNRGEMEMLQMRTSALQRAGALSTFHTLTGNAANANLALERYDAIGRDDLRRAAEQLVDTPKIVLSVVPAEHPGLAPPGSEEVP